MTLNETRVIIKLVLARKLVISIHHVKDFPKTCVHLFFLHKTKQSRLVDLCVHECMHACVRACVA